MKMQKNCQPIHIVKNNKVFIENNKGMTGQLLHKEITHGFNQPSQQKLGIYQQRHCQFALKGTKTDERQEGCQTSWILQDETIELSSY